jgi:hypothetical protein
LKTPPVRIWPPTARNPSSSRVLSGWNGLILHPCDSRTRLGPLCLRSSGPFWCGAWCRRGWPAWMETFYETVFRLWRYPMVRYLSWARSLKPPIVRPAENRWLWRCRPAGKAREPSDAWNAILRATTRLWDGLGVGCGHQCRRANRPLQPLHRELDPDRTASSIWWHFNERAYQTEQCLLFWTFCSPEELPQINVRQPAAGWGTRLVNDKGMPVCGLATQVPGIAVRASIQFAAFCHRNPPQG